ncbi:MAG: SLAC1 anion channel family protein [Geminicoccaceae bacterium]
MASGDPATPVFNDNSLAHLPVSVFSIVMGSAGLTLAMHRFEQVHGLSGWVSTILCTLTLLVLGALVVLFARKALVHPQAAQQEWRHPVRLSFFPAISIGMILSATALLPHLPSLAHALWLVGVVAQGTLAMLVVTTWINEARFEHQHLNPAWFIPAVGNVVVPIGGVQLGYVEVSWLFWSFGVLMWLVLLTVVINRLIIHQPLPERLLPTLCILIAPPAAALIAYIRLTEGIDPFARFLFANALAFAVLVALQLPKLVRLPFSLAWWAYSFPLAALAVSASLMAEHTEFTFYAGLADGLTVILTLLVVGLAMRTIEAARQGALTRPDAG